MDSLPASIGHKPLCLQKAAGKISRYIAMKYDTFYT
jgi:hypothetical protein